MRIIIVNNGSIIMKSGQMSVVYRTVLDVRWSSDKQSVISSSQGILFSVFRILLVLSLDLII